MLRESKRGVGENLGKKKLGERPPIKLERRKCFGKTKGLETQESLGEQRRTGGVNTYQSKIRKKRYLSHVLGDNQALRKREASGSK